MFVDLIVVGGGAAGFFSAITCAELSEKSVLVLEKTSQLLQKVRISGGGRCNVTHACFEPRELATFYPRGEKSLIGPFHRFGPTDTVEWFESRGVAKIDGAYSVRIRLKQVANSHATQADDGLYHASFSGGQGSQQLSAMAAANALTIVPSGDGIATGEPVDLLLL